MNYEKYVLVGDDYIPENFCVGELKIEYRKEAMLGDFLYPRVTYNENEIDVVFAAEDGNVYAILKYLMS